MSRKRQREDKVDLRSKDGEGMPSTERGEDASGFLFHV